jgi:hypothetical protein
MTGSLDSEGMVTEIITSRGDSILTTVAELISPVIGQWDQQLVVEMFSAAEACMILQPRLAPIISFHLVEFILKNLQK